MAILDEALQTVVDMIAGDVAEANLTRLRGGLARGVAWLEASGRATDGAWLELRVHHRPAENRLQAGMLAYQPLAGAAGRWWSARTPGTTRPTPTRPPVRSPGRSDPGSS
jgi:hypothetical protein